MTAFRCIGARPRSKRPTLSITIDRQALDGLKKWMKKTGRNNISAAIQGFIECGIRDTCEGCPYYEELPEYEKERVKGKVGVGKWTDE